MRLIITVMGDATGGRWKVVLDYVEVLRDSGHQVLLVINSKKVSPTAVLPTGVEVAKIRNSGHYDLLATLSAMKLLRKFQPDVVICHCGSSVSLMKKATWGRIPLVAVNHSNNVKRSVPADAYFNISTHIGKLINAFPSARGVGFHIPNMVEIPPDASWSSRVWHEPVRIGAFGRFDVVKGFHVFIEALGLLKKRGVPFAAQLGGAGQQKDELLQLVSSYGLENELRLTGWVEDQRQFFAQTDIFCIPALSDAFGITPLEAAVAGVPIVLSDAEGHKEMFVHGQHALLVPRGNAQLLADALEEMIASPQRAEQLSRAAFKRVIYVYGKERFTQSINDALSSLISDRALSL